MPCMGWQGTLSVVLLRQFLQGMQQVQVQVRSMGRQHGLAGHHISVQAMQ